MDSVWPNKKLNMQSCMDWNSETGTGPSELMVAIVDRKQTGSHAVSA